MLDCPFRKPKCGECTIAKAVVRPSVVDDDCVRRPTQDEAPQFYSVYSEMICNLQFFESDHGTQEEAMVAANKLNPVVAYQE